MYRWWMVLSMLSPQILKPYHDSSAALSVGSGTLGITHKASGLASGLEMDESEQDKVGIGEYDGAIGDGQEESVAEWSPVDSNAEGGSEQEGVTDEEGKPGGELSSDERSMSWIQENSQYLWTLG